MLVLSVRPQLERGAALPGCPGRRGPQPLAGRQAGAVHLQPRLLNIVQVGLFRREDESGHRSTDRQQLAQAAQGAEGHSHWLAARHAPSTCMQHDSLKIVHVVLS